MNQLLLLLLLFFCRLIKKFLISGNCKGSKLRSILFLQCICKSLDQVHILKELTKYFSIFSICIGAPGAPRSLYVFTEHCRYLFNCGEGTQRLANEHKVKMTQIEHVLITSKSWENIGGLPGALLTLQDTGVPEIRLHGPPGIVS